MKKKKLILFGESIDGQHKSGIVLKKVVKLPLVGTGRILDGLELIGLYCADKSDYLNKKNDYNGTFVFKDVCEESTIFIGRKYIEKIVESYKNVN